MRCRILSERTFESCGFSAKAILGLASRGRISVRLTRRYMLACDWILDPVNHTGSPQVNKHRHMSVHIQIYFLFSSYTDWLSDRFYIALFFALEQTHCTLVACVYEWMTELCFLMHVLNIYRSGVLTELFGCYMGGATWNCCRPHHKNHALASLYSKPHT